jgi:hypothetical protein
MISRLGQVNNLVALTRKRAAIKTLCNQLGHTSSVDYSSREFKDYEKTKSLYERCVGPLYPKTGAHGDVAGALLVALNDLHGMLIPMVSKIFQEDEVRRFILCHGVFSLKKNSLQTLVCKLTEPTEEDIELFYPTMTDDLSEALKLLKDFEPEVVPSCIFIDGCEVRFDLDNTNEWGRPGNCVIIIGDVDFPDDLDCGESQMKLAAQLIAEAVTIKC